VAARRVDGSSGVPPHHAGACSCKSASHASSRRPQMCGGRDGLFLDSGPRGCALARGAGLFHARSGRVPASRWSALGGRFVPSTGKQTRRGESTWRRPDDGWAGHRPHRAGGQNGPRSRSGASSGASSGGRARHPPSAPWWVWGRTWLRRAEPPARLRRHVQGSGRRGAAAAGILTEGAANAASLRSLKNSDRIIFRSDADL
jgi:hypothetical protein